MKLYIEPDANDIAQPGEVHLHIRFRPANAFGIVAMLLVHAILLWFILHVPSHKKKQQPEGERIAMMLVLDQPKKPQTAKPQPKRVKTASAARTPTKHALTQSHEPPSLVQTPSTIVAPEPQVDMSSMLNAARERRRQLDEAATQENDAFRPPSAQQLAEANVRRSMQMASGGTGGLFEILSKSTRTATFSFRGWKPGAGSTWKQVIEVDAGLGGDIDIAIVRRMIVLIRTHYTGDFTWDSQRLGRSVTMSARVKDTAELESFMMQEFFPNRP